MFVRTRPKYGARVLVTADEAREFDKDWAVWNDLEWWIKNNKSDLLRGPPPEGESARRDGGPNEIRTGGSVRHRFGLFGPESALFNMKSTGERN